MASGYSLILLATLCFISPVTTAIPPEYRQVARQESVPAEILYAVTLTESGIRQKQGISPWPWSLNVAGKSYRYASQNEACRALRHFIHHQRISLKRIDVGLAQVNLGWNGDYFASPCAGLDPQRNLQAAARILHQRYHEQPGSWLHAAARYHRPAGGTPARQYRQKVKRHVAQLTTAIPANPTLIWLASASQEK